MTSHTFISNSPAATHKLGVKIGEKLFAGSVMALIGELGCGKTLITRGICAGLGVDEHVVNSPTFAFVNEYQGRMPVFHIDLYRLDSLTEELGIGLLDYLTRGAAGVVIVEWAEKMQSLLPDERLEIRFEAVGARKRKLTLIGYGKRATELLKELPIT